MKWRRLWAVVSLAVRLAACSGGGSELPWSEDFSSPGAWKTESDSAAEVAIQDEVMRIYVAIPNQLAWATTMEKDLRDFHLTVEASQVGGPDNNEYGVMVRYQDPQNFYRFSISGDGYFLVTKSVDGELETLGSNWTISDAIHQGQATNVLDVICEGDTLTFEVNGQQLAQVTDDEFAHGGVGLYAGTFYEGGVEIHFDNLRAEAP